VVVNNAGYGMTGTVEETGEQEIRKIFEVNVIAAIGFRQPLVSPLDFSPASQPKIYWPILKLKLKVTRR
jgi:NAD(P)-dependent dehydrogenase (short-subunit alcohol dehydrogenase family)